MALSEQELGKLVMDFYDNESRLAHLKALLAQTSENMELLATRMTSQPESITVAKASIVFKDTHGKDRTVPTAALEIDHICEALAELQQATARENEIKMPLTRGGQRRLAHALETQGPPISDILRRSQ